MDLFNRYWEITASNILETAILKDDKPMRKFGKSALVVDQKIRNYIGKQFIKDASMRHMIASNP